VTADLRGGRKAQLKRGNKSGMTADLRGGTSESDSELVRRACLFVCLADRLNEEVHD